RGSAHPLRCLGVPNLALPPCSLRSALTSRANAGADTASTLGVHGGVFFNRRARRANGGLCSRRRHDTTIAPRCAAKGRGVSRSRAGECKMIALVGQSVVDRVKLPGHPWVERLGGAPLFAATALRMAGRPAVILTRGATSELRAPLHRLGFPVIEGPATSSC